MTWIILGLVLGIPFSLIVLAFIVGCFEKHPVRMFEHATPASLPPYVDNAVQRAMSYGFVYRASGTHVKYKEKLVGSLLLSADCAIAAIAGEGTIVGMKAKKTFLLSRFDDGSMLMTTDDVGTAELDPLTRRQILMDADFAELYDRHAQAVSGRSDVVAFEPDATWDDIDDIYRARADRIVQRGLAQYVDREQDHFRYTPIGSFRLTIVHGIGQLLRPSNYARSMRSI